MNTIVFLMSDRKYHQDRINALEAAMKSSRAIKHLDNAIEKLKGQNPEKPPIQ